MNEDTEHKREAHEYLMKANNWLGVVYREQVKRVRGLRRQLKDQEVNDGRTTTK